LTDYLLATNVVSELVRPNPNTNVVAWVRAEDEIRFYLSVLSFGEIRRGIEQLPQSPRRERLRL
jgi:toxin FitB